MSRLSTRISIKWASEPASEPTDTLVMSVGEQYMDLRVTKADTTIDWAMSGQRLIQSEDPFTVQFTHDIDSRGYTDPDIGVFTKLPNGDDLEVGEMPRPEKGGAVTAYEEIWHEFPAPPPGTVSWILRHDDDEGTGTTFLGRLASSYLAFRKTPQGEFTALREELDAETDTWKEKYLIGTSSPPSMNMVASADPDTFGGKKEVTIHGATYRIVASAVEGKD